MQADRVREADCSGQGYPNHDTLVCIFAVARESRIELGRTGSEPDGVRCVAYCFVSTR